MHIHFNQHGIKLVEKETKERRLEPLFFSKNELLGSALTSFHSRGIELSEEKFKKIFAELCKAFSVRADYSLTLSQCVSDGHCKNETDVNSVAITDGIFSIRIRKDGLWTAKILDYGRYDEAINSIIKALSVLTVQGFFKQVQGVFAVQDGNTEIYFHTVFAPKGSFYYRAYHSAYDKIQCYAKTQGPNGDLFVFKYEMPRFFSSVSYYSPKESPFEDGSFELMIGNSGEKEQVPFKIMKTKDLKENFYLVKVGLSGRTHSSTILEWRFPLCVVFTAKSIDEALSKLHYMITNRGLTFVDYDKFKEAVLNAKIE
jgi:hypothetical protein